MENTPEILQTKRNSIENFLQKKDLKVLSLFSGCGGMDLGFEGGFRVHKNCINELIHPNWVSASDKEQWVQLPHTRFKTVFANDIRPGALKAWTNFFPHHYNLNHNSFHLESIVERVKRYWDGEKSVFPKNIDLITGGFPCQDFSVAGKRNGFRSNKNHNGGSLEEPSEENRGQLYIWMREVIDIVQPKMFIAENVKGLTSLGNAKSIIQNDFENIGESGYIVINSGVIHAGDYGVPQSRERIFFIGFRKDSLKKEAIRMLSKNTILPSWSPFPSPTHTPLKNDPSLKEYVNLNTIFKGLKEPSETGDLDQATYSKAKWYGTHCQGNKEVNLKGIGPTIRAEHHGNIEFRRLAKKHGGASKAELVKGLKERRLSLRECCRIQTFPDNYKFVSENKKQGVSGSEAYKLIGNAVPPLLAFHFAKKIESLWHKYFRK